MAFHDEIEAQLRAENAKLKRALKAALQATTTATLSAVAARDSAASAWKVAFRPPAPRRREES